jgi:hypothetical protein
LCTKRFIQYGISFKSVPLFIFIVALKLFFAPQGILTCKQSEFKHVRKKQNILTSSDKNAAFKEKKLLPIKVTKEYIVMLFIAAKSKRTQRG